MIKKTPISIALILVIGIAAWTTLSYRPRNAVVAQASALPDAYMEDVTALIMDKYGKPKMKIVTPKMVHYANDDTATLTAPELTIYRKSPLPWYVTSDYANTSQGIDRVYFWNHVVIHHPADIDNPATLIKTPTLTVMTNQKTAETKDEITMVQPNFTVRAIGMQADLDSGNIKLLSAARGEYVPTP